MRKILFVVVGLTICFISKVYAEDISFTQKDRDRLIKLEVKMATLEEGQKSLQRQIDDFKESTQKQFENVQKQFDRLYTLILWGFGILFGGMGLLMSIVIWDRKTTLSPVVKQVRELEYREEKIERVFKELASKDNNVAEALKHAGLL